MSKEPLILIAAMFKCLALLIIYFIPSIVAHKKNRSQGICLLNLFLGWTLIGWVAALIWAVCEKKEQ